MLSLTAVSKIVKKVLVTRSENVIFAICPEIVPKISLKTKFSKKFLKSFKSQC